MKKIKNLNKKAGYVIIVTIMIAVILLSVGYQTGVFGPQLTYDPMVSIQNMGTSENQNYGMAQSFVIPAGFTKIGEQVTYSVAWWALSGGGFKCGISRTKTLTESSWSLSHSGTATEGIHTVNFGATVDCIPGETWYFILKPAYAPNSRIKFHHSVENAYTGGTGFLVASDGTTFNQQLWDLYMVVYGYKGTSPMASFTWSPVSPKIYDVVTFDGSLSTDASQYRWRFETTGSWSGWSSNPIATYT
ncbi:MAG: hypothetical protein IMZ53_16520, partial [Thermoplasmata archaeon]|nr:hypothetical protein [Thermoplasmata archaeon]